MLNSVLTSIFGLLFYFFFFFFVLLFVVCLPRCLALSPGCESAKTVVRHRREEKMGRGIAIWLEKGPRSVFSFMG